MGYKYTVLDSQHAWGYYCSQDFGLAIQAEPRFKHFVCLQNTFNASSILLSPLIGIIRAVVALYALQKLNQIDQDTTLLDLSATKRFFSMSLLRGVLEILCLGIFMGTIVDGLMTCKQKGLCCFSKPKSTSGVY